MYGNKISEYNLPFDASKILYGDIDGDNSYELVLSDTAGERTFLLGHSKYEMV